MTSYAVSGPPEARAFHYLRDSGGLFVVSFAAYTHFCVVLLFFLVTLAVP